MATAERFTMVPHWVLDDLDLTPTELAVYLALLRFRDPKTGKCFPGFSAIAKRASISAKSVQRTIPLLEERGMIRVTRRKSGGNNMPNIYTVALPISSGAFSAPRGRDRKSTGGDNESSRVAFEEDDNLRPRDKLSPPTDKLSSGVGTESPHKKTQVKKTQEEEGTRIFDEEASALFSFEVDTPTATEPQLAYLRDLVLQLHHQEPDDLLVARWRKLPPPEATEQIRAYLKALGRPDEHWYPQHGEPAFEALSPAGQEFAETAGMPDSVHGHRKDSA